MPLGKNVSKNIGELHKAHPTWSHKHVVAAALNGARSAGNTKIKPLPKRRNGKRRVKR